MFYRITATPPNATKSNLKYCQDYASIVRYLNTELFAGFSVIKHETLKSYMKTSRRAELGKMLPTVEIETFAKKGLEDAEEYHSMLRKCKCPHIKI